MAKAKDRDVLKDIEKPPLWTLGLGKTPRTEDEWRQWGELCKKFITDRLHLKIDDFAMRIAVSRAGVWRWFVGNPLKKENQNIISNLVMLVESRGVEKALELLERYRDEMTQSAPSVWHLSEIRSFGDRVRYIETALDELSGLRKRLAQMETEIANLKQAQLSAIS